MNHDGRPHSADSHHHEEVNLTPGGVGQSRTRRTSQASGLCQTLGSTLYFLDALGGAVFLPVLPIIIQEVVVEDASNSAAYCNVATWVGLLSGAYYTGNLIAGQVPTLRAFCASAGSPDGASSWSLLVGVGLVLGLSAGTYIACGLVVVRDLSLWWFASLRLLSGMLAAAHRVLGFQCLEIIPTPRKQREGSIAAMTGLVVGCAVSGEVFSPDQAKPLLRLCLAAAGAHVPSLILLIFIWCRYRTSSRGAGVVDDWTALANSDCGSGHATYSRHAGSAHSFVRRELGGGGEIEVELARAQSAAAVADRRGSSSGGGNPQIDEKQQASLGPAQLVSMAEVRGGGGRPTTAGDELAGGSRVDGDTADQTGIQIPDRYLRGCKGDPVEAERRWRLTLEWRAQERVDEVLREPQPHFDVIKRHYPHFIHRRARNGCPVWVELPGRINLPAIRSSGVSTEALRRHYVFVTEYLWGVVETDFDHGQAVTVLDVQGLGMRDLAGEALGFVKQATAIVQDHYVERSNRMFIINTPSYFSMIWRVISPMLNERTQAKIGIVNTDKAKIAKALLECIPPENLPTQYGGTCPLELGESEEERDLRAYVASITPDDCNRQQKEENEVEVEVQLRSAVGNGSRSDGDGEGRFMERKPEAAGRSPAGDPWEPSGQSSERSGAYDNTDTALPPGAARRVLSKVGGALGRVGGVIFRWRRSPAPRVAHLGEENAFVYDAGLQRWVLKGESGGGRGSRRRRRRDGSDVSGDGGSPDGPSGPRGEPSVARRGREDSIGSSTSEEMTVLAIQAAHYSLNEAAVDKVPLARRNVSPLWEGAAAGRDSGNHPHRDDAVQRLSNISSASTEQGAFMANSGGDGARRGDLSRVDGNIGHEIEENVVLSCSCCTRKPFGHHDEYRRQNRGLASFLASFASICYALGVAIRESLPLWALAGTRDGGLSAALDGGLGVTPRRVGFAMAAGVLVAAVGRAIASAGWCGSLFNRSRGGQSGWSKGGEGSQIINAVRGRLVTVTALGILYTIARVSSAPPAIIGAAVVWLAVVAAVASNQIAIELCLSRNFRHDLMGNRVSGDVEGREGARGEGSAPLRWLMANNRGFLFGDVVGSVGGPLLLALGLRSGLPSPFDTSLWFLLCLCVDVCISVWARLAGGHTKLLDGEDEAEQDMFGGSEWRPHNERFPEFV